jgi:hypothetical protein
MRLIIGEHLTPGTLLRITLHDSTLFGEVRYCCPWLQGFVAGLLVERVLLGTSEPSRIVAALVEHIPSVRTERCSSAPQAQPEPEPQAIADEEIALI